MSLCNCPQDAAISDVPLSDCPFSLGQVQKAVLQREYSTGTTKNYFDMTTADPTLLASWTAVLSAEDGTKVVQTPYLTAPTMEAGAAKVYGDGGNETLGGTGIIVGREKTSFTANILQANPSTIKALKTFQCENAAEYYIDEFGRIAGVVDDLDTPTKFYPIPVKTLFVGDNVFGGLDNPDMNVISWNHLPNWSDNLYFVTPSDFNALTDLVTP